MKRPVALTDSRVGLLSDTRTRSRNGPAGNGFHLQPTTDRSMCYTVRVNRCPGIRTYTQKAATSTPALDSKSLTAH
jgi:hypothetical protein